MKFLKRLFKKEEEIKEDTPPSISNGEAQPVRNPTKGMKVRTPFGRGRIKDVKIDSCMVMIKGIEVEVENSLIFPRAKDLPLANGGVEDCQEKESEQLEEKEESREV